MKDIAAVGLPSLTTLRTSDLSTALGQSATIVTHIFKEMELHIGYCEGFGISKEEMENTEENTGKPPSRLP